MPTRIYELHNALDSCTKGLGGWEFDTNMHVSWYMATTNTPNVNIFQGNSSTSWTI